MDLVLGKGQTSDLGLNLVLGQARILDQVLDLVLNMGSATARSGKRWQVRWI